MKDTTVIIAGIVFIILLVAGAVTYLTLGGGGQHEEFKAYFTSVSINHDGSLFVEEKITVRALGKIIKRGIVRDIPISHVDPRNKTFRQGLSPKKILFLRNGEFETYHSDAVERVMRYYIGAKDRLVPPGVHEYVIRYQTAPVVGSYEGKRDLVLSAVTPGWNQPIGTIIIEVTLPPGVPMSGVTGSLRLGQSEAPGAFSMAVVEQKLVFRSNGGILAPDGVTLFVSWDY